MRRLLAHSSLQQDLCDSKHILICFSLNIFDSKFWTDPSILDKTKVCGEQMRQETQPRPCFGSCNSVIKFKCSGSVKGSALQQVEFPKEISLTVTFEVIIHLYYSKISTLRRVSSFLSQQLFSALNAV